MKKFTKTNSSYKGGRFHVGSTDVWGNYCPETKEYYLARNDFVPGVGECTGVVASCWLDDAGYYEDNSADGYSYEVVRELLQLGHLTAKTLASFIEAGGEVWWNQPQN